MKTNYKRTDKNENEERKRRNNLLIANAAGVGHLLS